MPSKGYKMSDESKDKMRLAKIGYIPWNKGTHGKMNIWNKGIKLDKEKYPNAGHTQKHSDDTKKKISRKKIGIKRKPFTDDTRKKISEAHKGEKNFFWKGGKSFEMYSVEWTQSLRIAIRERDRYVCQICSEKQGDITHHVHHIDYDKKNSNPINLITLCKSCHMKTNANRANWIIYFKNKQL